MSEALSVLLYSIASSFVLYPQKTGSCVCVWGVTSFQEGEKEKNGWQLIGPLGRTGRQHQPQCRPWNHLLLCHDLLRGRLPPPADNIANTSLVCHCWLGKWHPLAPESGPEVWGSSSQPTLAEFIYPILAL